jgi:hypothetical protein
VVPESVRRRARPGAEHLAAGGRAIQTRHSMYHS